MTDQIRVYQRAIDYAADHFRRYGKVLPLQVRQHRGKDSFSFSVLPGDFENGMEKALRQLPANSRTVQL